MAGLNTYPVSEQQTSALCGYGARQADVQNFLTDAQVAAATGVDDLIADVEAAVVAPGLEDQRLEIVRCLREGKALGDWSDSRVQGVSTVTALANLTWVDQDTSTGHLGVNLIA